MACSRFPQVTIFRKYGEQITHVDTVAQYGYFNKTVSTQISVTAMDIGGFAINLERCRDGVELIEQRDRMLFRYRSERIDRWRHTFVDLEKTVLVDFVNAVDDKQRQAFFEQHGLMLNIDRGKLLRRDEETREAPLILDKHGHRPAIDREAVLQNQSWFRALLLDAGSGVESDAIVDINGIYAQSTLYDLAPAFHRAGPSGTPQVVMESRTVIGFMMLEAAMIATNGARVHECEYCKSLFLTGPATWRRSHAVYCSDKCRVAAMRARKAAG
jgi:hypothetical protein